MEKKDIHSELASIRSLMERSSRFLSLSGLSGVLAGIYASIGAFGAYQLVTDKYNSLINCVEKLNYPPLVGVCKANRTKKEETALLSLSPLFAHLTDKTSNQIMGVLS